MFWVKVMSCRMTLSIERRDPEERPKGNISKNLLCQICFTSKHSVKLYSYVNADGPSARCCHSSQCSSHHVPFLHIGQVSRTMGVIRRKELSKLDSVHGYIRFAVLFRASHFTLMGINLLHNQSRSG